MASTLSRHSISQADCASQRDALETPVSSDTGAEAVSNPCGAQSVPIQNNVWTPVAAPNSGNSEFGPPAGPNIVRPQTFASLFKVTNGTNTDCQAPLPPSEILRCARTFIVRRAPYDLKTEEVVESVSAQLGIAPRALFESVVRDPKDRRRLYLTFTTLDHKRTVEERGFMLRDLHIKPSDGYVSGYIPHPPYFVDLPTMTALLSQYGTVKSAVFVTTRDGVRIAGLRFSLLPKSGVLPPREVKVRGFLCSVLYSDDPRICSFCKAYGHTIGHCRKKQSALHVHDSATVAAEDPSARPVDPRGSGGGDPAVAENDSSPWIDVRPRRRRQSSPTDKSLSKKHITTPDVIEVSDDHMDDDDAASTRTARTETPDVMDEEPDVMDEEPDVMDEEPDDDSDEDGDPADDPADASLPDDPADDPADASLPDDPGDDVVPDQVAAAPADSSPDAPTCSTSITKGDMIGRMIDPLTPRMIRYLESKQKASPFTGQKLYSITVLAKQKRDAQLVANIHQQHHLQRFMASTRHDGDTGYPYLNPLNNPAKICVDNDVLLTFVQDSGIVDFVRRVGYYGVEVSYILADQFRYGKWRECSPAYRNHLNNVYDDAFHSR